MKKTITYLLCACTALLIQSRRAGPLPCRYKPLRPPQQPNSAQHKIRHHAWCLDHRAGMLNSPLHFQSLTAGSLNGQLLSIWDQQYLTGDWGGFRDQMLNHGVPFPGVDR